jgi:hypothetical protein
MATTRFGNIVAQLFGSPRIGDINHAQSTSKPGHRQAVVVDLLLGLMTAVPTGGIKRLVVSAGAVGGDGHGIGFLGDIDNPQKGIRGGRQAVPHFFVAHHENAPAMDLPRNR